MRILSVKPGHDGTVAVLENSRLLFSLEAEKDSFPRYETVTPTLILKALSHLTDIPDVIAVSGWVKGWHSIERELEAGYFGFDNAGIAVRKITLFGKELDFFSSTHERSHVLSTYGMSPFAQGTPCYVLVWEGNLGSFYEVNEAVKITKVGHVLEDPGNKYSFLFFLADPSFPHIKGYFRHDSAGKLMALASFSERGPVTAEEAELIEYILGRNSILLSTAKTDLKHSRYFDIGVETDDFKNLAGKFSDALFDRFYKFAKNNLRKKLPLLISGGCGLNCDWNTKWRESDLFTDVFVPPCPNDSGSAIGTAVDALLHYTGVAKIKWDVYAGEPFIEDVDPARDFEVYPLNYAQIAAFLRDQKVIAWVQGKYEIGPRALGNRSILAAPFETRMHERLNQIKQREKYRPIAAACLEESVSKHFQWNGASPYMLYFQRVKTDRLGAVTHVDNTVRLQSVNKDQNEPLFNLLVEFDKLTGFAVLCNTSLNFKGRGFINRMSDLIEYQKLMGLDGFVVSDRFYIPANRT